MKSMGKSRLTKYSLAIWCGYPFGLNTGLDILPQQYI